MQLGELLGSLQAYEMITQVKKEKGMAQQISNIIHNHDDYEEEHEDGKDGITFLTRRFVEVLKKGKKSFNMSNNDKLRKEVQM